MNVYFHSFSAFLHMGHYAAYVWPAYAIGLLLLLIPVFLVRRHLKSIKTIKSEAVDA